MHRAKAVVIDCLESGCRAPDSLTDESRSSRAACAREGSAPRRS